MALKYKNIVNLSSYRLPDLNPEVTSYILNKGNYDFWKPSKNLYEEKAAEAYELMNGIIRKKLMMSETPIEQMHFS